MIKKTQIAPNCEVINVIDESMDELNALSKDYEIDTEFLMYARDYDERSRIEFDDGGNWNLIVYDIATVDGDNQTNFADPTAPITFIFKKNVLFLFTSSSTYFDAQKLIRIPSDLKIDQIMPIDIVLLIMYGLTSRYFDAIHLIDKRRQEVQRSLTEKTSRSAITQLMGLQTQLVYYLTALNSDNRVLNEIGNNKMIRLTDNQIEQLKDVQVEIQQGLEMAQMASDVIQHVSDAYSNVLDNTLNNTMKLLTICSIILAVPTIIFGFFGQNVRLPFANSPWGWLITIFVSFIFAGLFMIFYQFYQRIDKK